MYCNFILININYTYLYSEEWLIQFVCEIFKYETYINTIIEINKYIPLTRLALKVTLAQWPPSGSRVALKGHLKSNNCS